MFGPGPRVVVQVPVGALGQAQVPCDRQAQRVHGGDEHQQIGQRLLGRATDFDRLLDRFDGDAAGIGQADDFRARALRLEQERRKVGAQKRVPNRTQHLAAVGLDDLGGILLQ